MAFMGGTPRPSASPQGNTGGYNENIITRKNNALCRKHYFGRKINNLTCAEVHQLDLKWFKIKGISKFWKNQSQEEYVKVYENILSGIATEGSAVAFLINGTHEGISFYVGCMDDLYEEIKGSYFAYVSGVDVIEEIKYEDIGVCKDFGGVITGHPGEPINESSGKYAPAVLQVDNFCRGMLGTDFSFMVVAQRNSEATAQAAMDRILEEMFQHSDFLTMTRATAAGINRQVTNYKLQKYYDNLSLYSEFLESCMHSGFWSASIYYSAKSPEELARFQGVLQGSYASDSSVNFESLHCVPLSDNVPMSAVLEKPSLLYSEDEKYAEHPLCSVLNMRNETVPFYRYSYQTFFDSKRLAIFFRLPQKEYAGYYIDDYVEFDTTVRRKKNGKELLVGDITYPGRDVKLSIENKYSMDLNDLTRHALIIGITGGGKTNTSKSILRELWIKNRIPFLVIESAKREYWELVNLSSKGMLSEGNDRDFSDLNLFTLGWESDVESVKYRINPFEAAEGVSLQTHIDYLLSTFKAAFELYSPMPYVLETAVYEVYKDRGWDIVNSVNTLGRKEYPTLTDLYYKIETVTDQLGYNSEVSSNVKAALKARINSLRIGGKGAMLDTPRSLDIGKLLETPTVFELEDLGDDDTKAFVIGILLVQLYEYRKSDKSAGGKDLKSVLMIEEAHRLLKNVPPSSGDNSRAKSVEFFCNMLAEIRSYGQGIIIADQVPTKLASDTIKNTNLKIVHRTVMAEDRKVIGEAMNMTEDQIEYLSSLVRGCAAVFSEGDNRPKLVKLPHVVPTYNYNRSEALERIKNNVCKVYGSKYDVSYREHMGCSFCESRGTFCEEMKRFVCSDVVLNAISDDAKINSNKPWTVKRINELITKWEPYISMNSCDKKICLVGYLMKKVGLSDSMQMKAMIIYMKSLF